MPCFLRALSVCWSDSRARFALLVLIHHVREQNSVSHAARACPFEPFFPPGEPIKVRFTASAKQKEEKVCFPRKRGIMMQTNSFPNPFERREVLVLTVKDRDDQGDHHAHDLRDILPP